MGRRANDETAIRLSLRGSRERQRASNKARAWLQNPVSDSKVNVRRQYGKTTKRGGGRANDAYAIQNSSAAAASASEPAIKLEPGCRTCFCNRL
jgi:hypothetical protein